jgi:cell division protease FtsH
MEVKAIVDQAHAQVRQLLTDRRDPLERLARRLLEQEVLEGAELRALLALPPGIAAACSPRPPQEGA